MRTRVSQSVQKAHPNIDSDLWQIACCAKDHDSDILIVGLFVRVITAKEPLRWAGAAIMDEYSTLYGEKIFHPAGRVNLSIGEAITKKSLITLFSHELRHIAQYQRERQQSGYPHPMSMIEAEEDCYAFEKVITKALEICHYTGYSEVESNEEG